MICKNCGFSNADGNRFCISCGNPLQQESNIAKENVQPKQMELNFENATQENLAQDNYSNISDSSSGLNIFNHPVSEVNVPEIQSEEVQPVATPEVNSIPEMQAKEEPVATPEVNSIPEMQAKEAPVVMPEVNSMPEIQAEEAQPVVTPEVNSIPEIQPEEVQPVATPEVNSIPEMQAKEEPVVMPEVNSIPEMQTEEVQPVVTPEVNSIPEIQPEEVQSVVTPEVNSMPEIQPEEAQTVVTPEVNSIPEMQAKEAPVVTPEVNSIPEMQTEEVQPVVTPEVNTTTNNIASLNKQEKKNYISILFGFLIKPITILKEKVQNFSIVDSVIITLLTTIVSVVLNFIVNAVNIIQEKSMDWDTGKVTTNWNFEKLKEIDYVATCFKPILYILVIIVAISLIYYIVALILKKKPRIEQLLGLTSLALLPSVITIFVLTPIISQFSLLIAIIVMLCGIIYSLLSFILGLNELIPFESDGKIDYQLICFIIIIILLSIMMKSEIETIMLLGQSY